MPASQRQQAHPDIWFAQPIEARQQPMMLPASEAKSFLPTIGLVVLPTFICAALLVVSRPNDAQSPTSSGKANTQRRTAAKPNLVLAQRTEIVKNGPTVEPPSDGTERLPLSFYTTGIRGSMFGAPVAPPPKPPVQKKVTPPPPPVKIDPPPPPNPLADWAYTGTIHMGEQMMALLENTKTKEGQYVRVGERFMGIEVTAISDQEVMVGTGATANRVAKSDSITVTPLDKNAPFLNGGGQPGQPGMPGQPGGPPAMPMPPPGGQVIMPTGRVFNASDMQGMRGQFGNRFNMQGGGGFNFGGRGRRGQ